MRSEVRAVGIGADSPHAPQGRRRQRAESARSRSGEDDIGIPLDLPVRDPLADRLVDEIAGVSDVDRDSGSCRSRTASDRRRRSGLKP